MIARYSKKSHWNPMQLIMTFRQYQILIFSCSQKYLWSEKEWSAKRCISKLRLCQIQTGTIFLKCTIRCQNHFKLTFLGSTSGYWRLHRKKFQAWKSNQSNNICIFCFHRKLTENWTQCFKHKRYLIVLLKLPIPVPIPSFIRAYFLQIKRLKEKQRTIYTSIKGH